MRVQMKMPSLLLRWPCVLAAAAFVVAGLVSTASARPAYGDARLLVVTDGADIQQEAYSSFWSSLEARGYSLTFRDIRDAKPSDSQLLTRYESNQFDGAILFAPSAKTLPADLSPQALFSYLTSVTPDSSSGNLLIALSSGVSEVWRDFAREFSIEFDEQGTALYDPVNLAAGSAGAASAASRAVDIPTALTFSTYPVYDSMDSVSSIVSGKTATAQRPIRYSGLVHQAIDLPLLIPILRAPSTSYPVDTTSGTSIPTPLEGGPLVAGEAAKLVSGFQTRLNSRIVWSGSVDLFRNDFSSAETANEAFIRDITQWVFGEKGIVKVEESRHFAKKDQEGTKEMKEQYRIGEKMVYELVLSEWNGERWTPPASITDLQLEVTMLDPHLRIPLTPSLEVGHRSSSSRAYTATFRLPDRHGVFTLLVDHKRQGMTWIEEKLQISITPLRHDEYERFITGAMPYYVTAGSMVVAWFIFSLLWLGIKEHDEKGKGKKKVQ